MFIKDKFCAAKRNITDYLFMNTNIFAKYFILFAVIFLIVLTVLGSSLFIIVNNYTANERTKLLRTNTSSLAGTVENIIQLQDMNKMYSIEKVIICETDRKSVV